MSSLKRNAARTGIGVAAAVFGFLLAAAARAQEPVEPLDPSDLIESLLAVLPGFEEISGSQLQDEIAELGGVPFRSPVTLEYIGRQELARYLQDVLDSEYPPDRAVADARTLIAFDLLPPGTDLRVLRSRILLDNIVGFYDERPGRKRLYAVSRNRQLTPLNQIILAHELRHALQDQYADLHGALPDAVGDFDDRRLAHLSLLEGDAMVVMERFLAKRLPGLDGEGMNLAGLAVPENALPGVPAVVRDQLVQPYLAGHDFAASLLRRSGWPIIKQAWGSPPQSTEQVLHPDKYFSGEDPVEVTVGYQPSGAARKLNEGVVGELLIRTLLGGSEAAAAGWGGDRFNVWDVSGKTLLVWRSRWDTADDRREFLEALRARYGVHHGPPREEAGFSLHQRGEWATAVGIRGDSVVLVASDSPTSFEAALRGVR